MNDDNNISKIYEILRSNNPFASATASHPLESRRPDVKGLYQKEIDGIKSVINSIQYNYSGVTATIFGEAGSGKTHLICRLFEELNEEEGPPLLFAYIKPFINADEGFRYLLREIFIYLLKKRRSKDSMRQWDHITSKFISSMLIRLNGEKRSKELRKWAAACEKNYAFPYGKKFSYKFRDYFFKYCFETLIYDYPDLSEDFLKVFLIYCLYPKKRINAMKWLKGGVLDADDIEDLNNPKNRLNESADKTEQEVKNILQSINLILEIYGKPLIIFFDQMENYEDERLLKKLEDILFCLNDQSNKMIPIVFIREEKWEKLFSKKFQKHIVERIMSNCMSLNGCSREESYELIRSRLNYVLGDIKLPNDLFPFLPDYKKELDVILKFKESLPRYVINQCNVLLRKILVKPLKAAKSLGMIYENCFQDILSDYDGFQPDKDRLLLTLALYLKNRPDGSAYSFTNLKMISSNENPYINMTGIAEYKKNVFKSYFSADVNLHHSAVGACLKRGISHLKRKAHNKAVYIRDERSIFKNRPKWEKTNDLKDEFIEKGGAFIILNKEDAAWWYALTVLKFDVISGDVVNANGKTATMDDLETFIREEINGDAYPAFKPLDEYFSSNKIVRSD